MTAEAGAETSLCGNASHLTVWSTCPPGLEELARDEALEKLHGLALLKAEASRGRVVCRLSPLESTVDQLKRVLDLRLAGNHFFVFHEFQLRCAGPGAAKPAALKELTDAVPQANWRLAMHVWRLFFYSQESHSGKAVGHEPAPGHEQRLLEPEREPGQPKPDGAAAKGADPSRLSFRCTCYRAGGRHAFQSMEAAASLGGAVQDYFGWNVNLTEFDVEVVLWIEGNQARLCLSLNRVCMDFRGQLVELGATALRASIAAGMLRLCRPAPGELLCDCVCGSASIPVEAWTGYPSCYHLAGDCHPAAVDKADANVRHWCDSQSGRPAVELVRWDLRNFPLRPASVDIFLADLPFGQRLGSKRDNRQLYPAALAVMARCSVPGTGRACLLSADRTNLSRAVRLMSSYWRQVRLLSVGIGGGVASMVLLQRNFAPVPPLLQQEEQQEEQQQHGDQEQQP